MSQAAVGRQPQGRTRPVLRAVESTPDPARVRAFFEEQLPKLIAMRADLFDKMRGSLAIFVQGAGEWTVVFGDHGAPRAITRGATFESDCTAVFSVAGFIAMLDGREKIHPTVTVGDARLLSRLGQVMVEPARGALGARLQISSTRR